MGIDICTMAKIPHSGAGGRPPSREELFERIEAAAQAFAGDDLLGRIFQSDRREHSLYLMLHPAGTPLEFTWNPDQTVGVEVRTSVTGPGFHAYAVDMLKHIGERCGLDWNWSEQADETDFAVSGDFEALQNSMLEYLRALSGMLEEHGPKGSDDSTMLLSWPLGGPSPLEKEYSASAMGPWPRAWWQELRESEDIRRYAAEYFPWWNRETDALFREQLGRYLLWSEIRWHPPEDEREEALYQLAIDCLDPSMPEVQELQELLDYDAESDELPEPRPRGAGYYRRDMRFHFAPGWSIVLPGHFYSQVHEDGSGIAFGYGLREVHLSTYTMGEEGNIPSAEQILSDNVEGPSGVESFEFSEEHMLGRGHIALEKDDDGEELWMVQGVVATEGAAALCTVTFGDPDDRDWAVRTFKSLRCSGRVVEE